MAPPRSTQPPPADEGSRQTLRHEIAALADALVDARPADRAALRARIRRAVAEHHEALNDQAELGRLLRHMITDLGGDGASLDTLYYARQLVVVADHLPN